MVESEYKRKYKKDKKMDKKVYQVFAEDNKTNEWFDFYIESTTKDKAIQLADRLSSRMGGETKLVELFVSIPVIMGVRPSNSKIMKVILSD